MLVLDASRLTGFIPFKLIQLNSLLILLLKLVKILPGLILVLFIHLDQLVMLQIKTAFICLVVREHLWLLRRVIFIMLKSLVWGLWALLIA